MSTVEEREDRIKFLLSQNPGLLALEVFQSLRDGNDSTPYLRAVWMQLETDPDEDVQFLIGLLGNSFQETRDRALSLSVAQFQVLSARAVRAAERIVITADKIQSSFCDDLDYCKKRNHPVAAVAVDAAEILGPFCGPGVSETIAVLCIGVQILDGVCLCGFVAKKD